MDIACLLDILVAEDNFESNNNTFIEFYFFLN